MTLRDRVDPQLLGGLDAFVAALGPRGLIGIEDPVERRATFAAMMAAGGAGQAVDDSIAVEDRDVPGPAGAPDVRVRVYRPRDAVGALPVIYYIHGGGFVIGSIDTEDPTTRMLCAALGCAAVSVEYRLAPEHPHPAPVEDCYAGLTWTAEHADELGIDATRIALYGASAGGGLAAATALMARDRGGPRLAFQMLVYPMLDDRGDTPSCLEIDDLGLFDGWASTGCWDALLGDRRATATVEPYAAPARAQDLAGLPPTWLETGELDALRDEDVLFGLRLMQAGVATDLRVHPGAYHGFDAFGPDADVSQRTLVDRLHALRRALA